MKPAGREVLPAVAAGCPHLVIVVGATTEDARRFIRDRGLTHTIAVPVAHAARTVRGLTGHVRWTLSAQRLLEAAPPTSRTREVVEAAGLAPALVKCDAAAYEIGGL